MKFIELFTFGKAYDELFTNLYDSDKLDMVLNDKGRVILGEEGLLRLGLDEDMFRWKHGDYILDIGFYGKNQTILKIMLVKCDDWNDQDKASLTWWKPLKSITCKSKDDVTKTVTEMLEYVKAQTGLEEKTM